jgi:pimeloyl-ACP methyl ester carboxylesterase
MSMRNARRSVYSLLAVILASGCATPRVSHRATERHLIYLHGRIVQEQQSARPQHPEHGFYELNAIAETLRGRGFIVTAEIRPKGTTVSQGADRAVEQVRRLLDSGVPPERITVLGASMGAAIALRVAARLQNQDVRFVLLGPCLSANVQPVATEERAYPQGHLLSIREESDVPSATCDAWPEERVWSGLHAREVVLETGTAHGFLYRPMPEWVEPAVQWASGGVLRSSQ